MKSGECHGDRVGRPTNGVGGLTEGRRQDGGDDRQEVCRRSSTVRRRIVGGFRGWSETLMTSARYPDSRSRLDQCGEAEVVKREGSK